MGESRAALMPSLSGGNEIGQDRFMVSAKHVY